MNPPKLVSILLLSLTLTALAACVGSPFPDNVFQSPLTAKSTESPLPAATLVNPQVQLSPLDAQSATTVAFDTNARCIQLDQFEVNLGNSVCIEATVLATENWGNDFVMWLDESPPTRYFVVRNTFYLGAEGSCMRIVGVVEKDQSGRLYVRADDPGQVSECQR